MIILLWYIIASIIVSIVFGINFFIISFIKPFKDKKVSKYIFQFIFFILFICMYVVSPVKVQFLNLSGVFTLKNIFILFITVLVTSYLASLEKREKRNIGESFSLGASMEIPQRLFMQTFFTIVLTRMNIEYVTVISIIMNTLLWLQFILIQDFMFYKSSNKETIVKLISSACFSIGIGYVYATSGCILLCMLGHGIERIIAERLRPGRDK